MSVTIPSLNDVTDILDDDMVMVTHSGGQTFKISGANLNKRNQAVIANSTTLTGAPLKTGNIVRAYFTADITGVNTTTGLVLNYNGSNKNVNVPKDGALVNFTAQNMGGSPTVYKYLQAYTTLELLYDGTNFIIIGNPVVISSSDYTIYADGLKRIDSVTNNDKNMVTSNAVYDKTFGVPYVTGTNYTITDLDNFKTPLITFVNNLSNNIQHCPSGAFVFVVMGCGNNGQQAVTYIRQFLFSYSSSSNMVTRVFEPNSNTWKSWEPF